MTNQPLSGAQKAVLSRMEQKKWYSAFALQCSISTLRALRDREIVVETGTLGALEHPRHNILYSQRKGQ